MRHAFVLPESISTVHNIIRLFQWLVSAVELTSVYLCDSVWHLSIDWCFRFYELLYIASMDLPLALQLLVALTSQSSRARCSHLKISVPPSPTPHILIYSMHMLRYFFKARQLCTQSLPSLVQAQKLYPLLDPDLVLCLELVGWCRAGIKAQSPNSLTKCRLVAWDTPAMPVLLHSLALAQHSRYFSGDGKSKRASRGSRNEERTTG